MSETGVEAPTKSAQWGERIAEQERSGLSVRQFCRGQGLKEHSFYAWRRRLRVVDIGEPQHEIGVRRALGAKRRDITLQFLLEAVVQTSVGGLIGVLLGLTAVLVIPVAWHAITDEHVAA